MEMEQGSNKKRKQALRWGLLLFLVFIGIFLIDRGLVALSLPKMKSHGWSMGMEEGRDAYVVVFPQDKAQYYVQGVNNDLSEARITLSGGKLTVFYGSVVQYESPDYQQVQDFDVVDIDRDGALELVFLLYDYKRFGSHHPFWYEEEEVGRRDVLYSHLYVYELREEECFQKWCSSGMPDVAEEMTVLLPNRQYSRQSGEDEYFESVDVPVVRLTMRKHGLLNGILAKFGKGLMQEDWCWDSYGFCRY